MPEPKTEANVKKEETKVQEDEPHINWLVVDRSLRPDGFHLEQEFTGSGKK